MGKKINRKEEQKSWIYVLWCKTIGILLMVLPILVYAALADYNATDPSFNKVTTSSQEVHNFLGLFGATAADAVLSTFINYLFAGTCILGVLVISLRFVSGI